MSSRLPSSLVLPSPLHRAYAPPNHPPHLLVFLDKCHVHNIRRVPYVSGVTHVTGVVDIDQPSCCVARVTAGLRGADLSQPSSEAYPEGMG